MASRWVRLLWVSPSTAIPSPATRVAAAVLVVIGAAATAWSGVVHLKLWNMEDGYAQLPVVGKMFLVQGIACLVSAVGVLALRRLAVVILGALLMAASVGGLVVSLRTTLFGYHEYTGSPYVVASLVIESLAVAVFVAVAVIVLIASRSAPARGRVV